MTSWNGTDIAHTYCTLWRHQKVNRFQYIKEKLISSVLDPFSSPTNLSCNLAGYLGLLLSRLQRREKIIYNWLTITLLKYSFTLNLTMTAGQFTTTENRKHKAQKGEVKLTSNYNYNNKLSMTPLSLHCFKQDMHCAYLCLDSLLSYKSLQNSSVCFLRVSIVCNLCVENPK